MKINSKKLIGPVLSVLIIVLSMFMKSFYTMRILSTLGIYLIISMGLNVLLGFTGLVSIGQAGIFGIAAYFCGILMERCGFNFWTAFFAAIAVGLFLGFGIGMITLKLESGYLAITTLGLCLMVKTILQNWSSMTNGFEGLLGIPKPKIFGYTIRTQNSILLVVVIVVLIVYWAIKFFLSSKYGRNLRASRDNEIAASMMGIDVVKTRLNAFIIASVTASIAGWLYAGLYGALFPDFFNMDLSVLFMCIVIVGGQGTIIGPIIGAFVVVYGKELLGSLGEGQMLVYGIILVSICVLQPSGLAGLFEKGKKALTEKLSEVKNGKV